VVRQRGRRQRRDHEHRSRSDRPARAERGRQVDADRPDGRVPLPVLRDRDHRWAEGLAQRVDLPSDRPRPRARGHVRRGHRLGPGARQRLAAQAEGPGRRDPASDRHRRDGTRAGPLDLHLQQGDEAADQDGDRAGARSRGAPARRALQRHGPPAADPADGPAAPPRRDRPDGAVQLAHPRGGGADRRQHPGDGGRAACGVRRLPADSPVDDRAPARVHDLVQRRPGTGRGNHRRRLGVRGRARRHAPGPGRRLRTRTLAPLAQRAGVRLYAVSPADESLESVFAYLVAR